MPVGDADIALVALEVEGQAMRGRFRSPAPGEEWCDRRLLARIHRYTLKSLRLQNRFKRLGALRGRSLDEIIKFAGKPSHRARLDSQHEVLEWRRVGFHLALRFTDGVCDGVENVAAP